MKMRVKTMADIEKLLADYIAEYKADGTADPRPYLEQAEGPEQDELAMLIDAYLAEAPGQSWDKAAFAQSPARSVADAVSLSLGGLNGAWPWLLPNLRKQAEIPRSELVHALAEALEVPDHEEKVNVY